MLSREHFFRLNGFKLVYDALWWLALFPAAFASTSLQREKLLQRFGCVEPLSSAEQKKVSIWLHAASVGEVEGAYPIARGIVGDSRRKLLFVTSMTESGCSAARQRIPQARVVSLAPLDCASCVRRFLRRSAPRVVLLTETELWPNYVLQARRIDAQIALINARMSSRSLSRYRLIRSLVGQMLSCVDLLLAQSEQDAQRYALLGMPEAKIEVVGNPKYDLQADQPSDNLRPALSEFVRGKRVLVAGSTAPGEEQVVLEAYKRLRYEVTNLVLVLAPRHLRRTKDVATAVRRAGLEFVRASTLDTCPDFKQAPVLILDTMGELRSLYKWSTLAFVGGSLFPGRGGQSLAEPAAAAVPVMFGPFHESQHPLAQALIEQGAGYVVRDADEIVKVSRLLLQNEDLRQQLGDKARKTLQSMRGATQRSLQALSRLSNLG